MATKAAYIDLTEGAAPATPATGDVRIYAKTDGEMYQKDDAGTETGMAGGGAGDITTDGAWVAKGDLIAGTAENTAGIVTVGANGSYPRANSGATAGIEWQKNNLAATAAPDADNDIDEGYTVGSRWIDTTADKEYVCLDDTDGAAVWTETTQAAGGGGGITSGTDQGAAGSAGTLYFRTDLGLLIYDDGTRWLTANEYVWTTPHFDSVLSSDSVDARMALPLGYDVYLTRWDCFMRLSSAATWTLLLSSVDHENDETSIDTQQHVYSSNDWWHYSNVLGNVISCAGSNAANEPTYLGVGYSEDSGSAGLHAGASVYYRLIIPDPA